MEKEMPHRKNKINTSEAAKISGIKNEINNIGSRVEYMKPEFIESIAVSCESDEV